MPAPNRRNKGQSLAEKVEATRHTNHLPDRRDRLHATRARQASEWEEAAARLSPASDLAERADQARTDYARAKQFEHFDTDVRRGRAKPPIVVLTPDSPPRYYLGLCLDCDCELWVHRARPRVPLCQRCRGRR